METFYEENQENFKMLKNKMTLDFNQPASLNKKVKLYKTCILESPDLKMLKLASPELERMIIQQNGLVTTTPTPSLANMPYFFKQEPTPTDEQEQFSRGFVDALNQLHQTNGQQHPTQQPTQHCLTNNNNHNSNTNNQNNSNSNNNQNSMNTTSSDSSSDLTIADTNRRNSYHNLVPVSVASATAQNTKFAVPQIRQTQVPTTVSTATAVNNQEQYVAVSNCQTTGAHVLVNSHNSALPPYSEAVHNNNNNNNSVYPMSIKVESIQREDSPMPGHTSIAMPIDMEDQERIKLERKRLRNRIAASKCRKRKLERISKLEYKVNGLKGENSELSVVVSKLRDQVCSLKQQVMNHVKCGCQLSSSARH